MLPPASTPPLAVSSTADCGEATTRSMTTEPEAIPAPTPIAATTKLEGMPAPAPIAVTTELEAMPAPAPIASASDTPDDDPDAAFIAAKARMKAARDRAAAEAAAPKLEDLYTVEDGALGEGGFASVRRAAPKEARAYTVGGGSERRPIPERVAVKVMLKSNPDLDAADVAREVAIMRACDHPHVCRLFEAFEDSHRHSLVLELCEGGELFERVIERGRYTEAEAAESVRALCSALEHLHQRRIVHRDLKPENILYASSAGGGSDLRRVCTRACHMPRVPHITHLPRMPHAACTPQMLHATSTCTVHFSPVLCRARVALPRLGRIVDFGVSRVLTTGEEMMHTACGSPLYVAPEVLRGDGYRGVASDMWSAGVVLHVLLVGYAPFFDEDLKRLFQAIRSGAYDLGSPSWDGVSAEARDLVRRLLETEPRSRLTATDALAHPWLASASSDISLGEGSIEALSGYKRKLRAAGLAVAAQARMRAAIRAVDAS